MLFQPRPPITQLEAEVIGVRERETEGGFFVRFDLAHIVNITTFHAGKQRGLDCFGLN